MLTEHMGYVYDAYKPEEVETVRVVVSIHFIESLKGDEGSGSFWSCIYGSS